MCGLQQGHGEQRGRCGELLHLGYEAVRYQATQGHLEWGL